MDPVSVEVLFDVVCPWCYIGKRNLERALEQWRSRHPSVPVVTRWHSYQLVPGIPEAGVSFEEFYNRRMGGPERARARRAQVLEAAARSGLTLDYERIKTFPNTGRAHRMLAFAAGRLAPERVEALVERLFAAYFQRGEDIADRETLLRIGEDFGLDRAQLAAEIAPLDMPPGTVSNDQVSGVPFFIFAQRYAVSGAQPPEVIFAALEKGAEASAPGVAPS